MRRKSNIKQKRNNNNAVLIHKNNNLFLCFIQTYILNIFEVVHEIENRRRIEIDDDDDDEESEIFIFKWISVLLRNILHTHL